MKSNGNELISAIHHSIAMQQKDEGTQYLMKIALRQRRKEFEQSVKKPGGKNPLVRIKGVVTRVTFNNPESMFLGMHAKKDGYPAALQMFREALKKFSPGNEVVVQLQYRNDIKAMVEPLVTSIEVIQ